MGLVDRVDSPCLGSVEVFNGLSDRAVIGRRGYGCEELKTLGGAAGKRTGAAVRAFANMGGFLAYIENKIAEKG